MHPEFNEMQVEARFVIIASDRAAKSITELLCQIIQFALNEHLMKFNVAVGDVSVSTVNKVLKS